LKRLLLLLLLARPCWAQSLPDSYRSGTPAPTPTTSEKSDSESQVKERGGSNAVPEIFHLMILEIAEEKQAKQPSRVLRGSFEMFGIDLLLVLVLWKRKAWQR
jgi:hypothetical protein